MHKSLEGKTALVTGASRGIGRAVALGLAAHGAAIAAGYVKNDARAREVVESIATAGGRAVTVQADLSRVSEVRRLYDEAERAIGKLDIVVANAATAIIKPVADCTEEDFNHVFDTNTKSVFFLLQEAARRLHDGGRIIVISTGGTKMFFSQTALYLGSKGAVEQFTRTLSRELGSRNITVNAVSPGFTDTELLPDRDRAVAAGMSPYNRIGTPEEVANAVTFLASDEARWITGQNLGVGGGVF